MGIKYWVLSGTAENWVTALEGNIWGVREGNLKRLWEKISNGDILFFYCLSPISGVIGFGKCQAKFKQDKPLWPDEIREDRVIYPYRWQFEPKFVLPRSEWKSRNISIGGDIKIGFRAGLNPAKDSASIALLNEKIYREWKSKVIEEPLSDFLGEVIKKTPPNQHTHMKDLLMKLGEIKGFIVEEEFRMDGQRLDVIWKRIQKGVPTYVFEVQVGGNVTEALGKLKHAYDLWNSNLYIVIEDKDSGKVQTLLSGTFHEIKDELTVILSSEIEEFYKIKIAEAKLGEKLKLL
jgi:predicted RNA-binding protein